ncbi:hypothetical protein [Streptomyces flaveus]|uniref:Gram-positive cocci surface proteins LPxTG domain-containing protein n=1 Tax=Streptomyces flaveus TaxID=66370 RepID=A0A917VN81_9ACTN|nr:hypothetical protein [Streptomyces flaveus]GGL02082.1 hypothetical protein GCM10010094_73700 [Streptomyces flaveus]
MTAHRRIAALVGVAPLLLTVWAACPATAQGAPEGATPAKSSTIVTTTPAESPVSVINGHGESVSSEDSVIDDRASTALPLMAGGAAGLLITGGAAYTLRRRR